MLEPRDLRFDLTGVPGHWLGGRRAVTLFLDNLSILFPPGEAFFIKSVWRFRDHVADERLAGDVRAFCAQEAFHTREHNRHNAMVRAQGYRAEVLENRLRRILELASRLVPARAQLAVTAALEHFTAIMARVCLTQPSALAGAHPAVAALWRWHAAEEYEHRAVSYDVYQAVGGRYLERVPVMIGITLGFWLVVLRQQIALMRDDGILFSPREWADLAKFLLVEPGLLRRVARDYFRYFLPSFHPAQVDEEPAWARWNQDLATLPEYRAAQLAPPSPLA